MALKNIPQAERLLSGTLTSYLSDVATTCVMSDPPSKFPTYIDLEPDSTTKKELIRAVAVSGSTVTIERSVNGVVTDHAANATYKQKITSRHWDAVSDALEKGLLMEDALRVLIRVSDTQFTITGYGASDDLTGTYTIGRVLRINSSASYVMTVTSSSYSAGTNKTTINVSATLPTPVSTVEFGIAPLGGTNLPLTSPVLTTPKVVTSINDENGNEVIKTPATASAVNEVTVTNSATGNAVQVSATGGDTDISLNLVSKGAGTVQVNGTAIVSSIISTTKYAPQGFLLNGKIVPSVASNDLTVAIKGMDGNDPSASNPVYVRIGDTVRTITAALSVTKADGTNWFNAGSAELATKEVDYFVYLGYNATDGTVIGFSRIPYATLYSDFSATSTNEKYCAISTITNAAAGDNYENVGRFAATLSAGAGYTWTVPTFTTTNLIQRPIYETRWSTAVFTVSGSTGSIGTYANSVQLALYKIERDSMKVRTAQTITNVGSWTGNLRLQLPMGSSTAYAAGSQVITTGAVLTSGGLTIEGWAYQIPATGLMTFVSSFNTVVYPFSSLAVSDVITVNADYPLI